MENFLPPRLHWWLGERRRWASPAPPAHPIHTDRPSPLHSNPPTPPHPATTTTANPKQPVSL
jgi:hypothetical protein